MTIAEQVYELVRLLPQDQASEVLTFAESIRARHFKANHPLEEITPSLWSDLVYSLAGTWAEDFPTLEDIRSEVGQDILRENL